MPLHRAAGRRRRRRWRLWRRRGGLALGMCARLGAGAVVGGVLLGFLLAAPAGAQSQVPPGFKAYLGGKPRGLVECSVVRRRLNCLVYDAPLPVGAECDFGGAVPVVQIRRAGRARSSYTCIDEAYHGWPTLRVGATFREGPFRCTRARRRLRCRNEGHFFTVSASGRIRRSA